MIDIMFRLWGLEEVTGGYERILVTIRAVFVRYPVSC